MTDRLLVGAGAQGSVVLEAWRCQHPGASFGLLDDSESLHGTTILGVKVLGPVRLLEEHRGEVVIALGDNATRLEVAATWNARARWGRVVHPTAFVAPSATIGDGAVLLAGAIVNTRASIGAHAVVNSGAVVEHDCVLEEGVSVSPGACMGGRVQIGRAAFISTGVTLAPRVKVGAGSVIGAGAVVASDIPAGVLAYGVPARVVRSLDGFDFRRLL